MISAVEMSGNRLVNIVVAYGTKMFGKPVRETSASLTDVEFIAFAAGYVVNDIGGSACEIMPDSKVRFGSKNDSGLTMKSTCVTAGSAARKRCDGNSELNFHIWNANWPVKSEAKMAAREGQFWTSVLVSYAGFVRQF